MKKIIKARYQLKVKRHFPMGKLLQVLLLLIYLRLLMTLLKVVLRYAKYLNWLSICANSQIRLFYIIFKGYKQLLMSVI